MDPQPTAPRDALARLLRALGVADSAIPTTTDDRSGLLRSVLRERQALLLLDNAADEDQVRPCCPAAAPRSRSSPAATPWPASNRSTAPN